MKLENKLIELDKEKDQIEKQIERRNKTRTIKCASCKKMHQIGSLDAIQTHWYVSPSGCTEGDYWLNGELQFICPETKIINRLLFFNNDIPWDKRNDYDYSPEKQFMRNYKHLFKSVKDTYDKDDNYKSVNNQYIDKHRKKFGLMIKK